MVIVSEKASRLHNGLKLILKKHFYSIEFVSTICLMQNEGFFFDKIADAMKYDESLRIFFIPLCQTLDHVVPLEFF